MNVRIITGPRWAVGRVATLGGAMVWFRGPIPSSLCGYDARHFTWKPLTVTKGVR